MQTYPIEDLILLFRQAELQINVCPVTELYWKRFYGYTSNERQLDMNEISYVIRGNIRGKIDGQETNLGPGDLFWIRSLTPHSLTWPDGLIYFTLRFTLTHYGQPISIDAPFLIRRNITFVEHYFRDMVFLLSKGTENKHFTTRLNALFIIIMCIVDTDETTTVPQKIRYFTELEKRTIFNYCQNLTFSNITSDDLSKRLSISRDYFSRLFTNTFGKSVRGWLYEEKIRFSARRLLDSEISIEELARQFGYSDSYIFSRQFKQVMGISPQHYRSANKQMTGVIPKKENDVYV